MRNNNKQKIIIDQNQYILVDGTSFGYSQEVFRNHDAIQYFWKKRFLSLSFLRKRKLSG